jgi:hypothetical protein
MTFHGSQLLRPNKDISTCLALDLKTPRLNAIHQHLWLAGLPNAARPLHGQKLLGRNIAVTEDPDEHLVWFETHRSDLDIAIEYGLLSKISKVDWVEFLDAFFG